MAHFRSSRLCIPLLLITMLLTACAVVTAQSFSQVLSFQGRLAELDTGKPLPDGQYQVTFRIYNAASGGTNLWTETQTVSQVGGIFGVYLGSVTAFPSDLFTDGDRWLSLQVSSDAEMADRFRFTPSPWAIAAGGLSLPYSGSASSSNPIFKITNTGYGAAIRGDNANGYGVYGWSLSSAGLYGSSSASAGVYGYANSRAGVEGLNGNYGNLGRLATDDFGVYGESPRSTGYGVFGKNTTTGAFGYLGGPTYGVEGRGQTAGGYFKELDSSAYAVLSSQNEGVMAYGTVRGGEFRDLDSSGVAFAASGDFGVAGYGNGVGGYFEDLNGSGYAYVGYGDEGISAHGLLQGGFFADDDNTSGAHIAYGDYGIDAYGDSYAGHFYSTQTGAEAWVAGVYRGIWAQGGSTGGHFLDTGDGTYADVASSTYKIQGTGSVSFVQNHPEEPDRAIVYAAPEGDEVATYTRGTAKLVNGKAVVPLGETFKWVTNPDIGLTAHLTPRGEWADLYIVSLTTEELVVASRDPGCSAAFDYLVYGLRIGFEEVSIVQDKEREAYIPSMADHRALYDRRPELRGFNALERFKRMRAASGEAGNVDLTASQELRDKIGEFDPAMHTAGRPVE